MKFQDNIPIYLQIEDNLYQEIALGHLKPGDQLPSVRQLAVQQTANVNTVQRALRQMNERGIIFTKRGQGNFVTTDQKLLAQTKQRLVTEQLAKFVAGLRDLGLSDAEIEAALADYLQNKEEEQDD
ncbi:MAG: GntR family transcriptional regulator [Lactobacillus sp.]